MKYIYDAFGVEKNIDENDTNAFRYFGEYYDAETGTIYLRARYYDQRLEDLHQGILIWVKQMIRLA